MGISISIRKSTWYGFIAYFYFFLSLLFQRQFGEENIINIISSIALSRKKLPEIQIKRYKVTQLSYKMQP